MAWQYFQILRPTIKISKLILTSLFEQYHSFEQLKGLLSYAHAYHFHLTDIQLILFDDTVISTQNVHQSQSALLHCSSLSNIVKKGVISDLLYFYAFSGVVIGNGFEEIERVLVHFFFQSIHALSKLFLKLFD